MLGDGLDTSLCDDPISDVFSSVLERDMLVDTDGVVVGSGGGRLLTASGAGNMSN